MVMHPDAGSGSHLCNGVLFNGTCGEMTLTQGGTPQHNAFPINIRLDMDLRGTANLVRLRQEKGLSQEALAREAGVNRSYLALLETGQHYVGLKIIGKLAEALEVELAELLKLPIEEDA